MNRPNRLKPALMACAAGLSLLAAQPAFAQTVDSAKLLELMVAKGLVTREEADGLLAQAIRAGFRRLGRFITIIPRKVRRRFGRSVRYA